RTGVNTVTVDVWWDVDPATQSRLYPGEITASDQQLASTIRAAEAQGLRAVLVPKLWCPGCQATDRHNWVGRIHPLFRDQFFADYRAFINRYAALAQANHVWLYVIGHEMNTLQGEEAQFRRVAAEVRRRYKGLICYGMDWSALAGYAPPVRFWDAVDVIGVSAYFPLSDAARPSVDELRSAWHSSSAHAFYGYRWFDKLAALAQATHRPVFFAEVGYLSSNYAGQAPGDPNHKATQPNQVVQANAYRALLQTFEPQPWWLGVVWWEWEQHSDNGSEPDYSPRNKVAERFLTAWYAEGWRPG
ncbi:MAG: glycoside hydrolase family 113, partial [Acidimicrobiales bacterium]